MKHHSESEKSKWEKTGIPRIAYGHMAAPRLTHRAEYGIFRKLKTSEGRAIPVPAFEKKKLQTIFKGAF